MGQNMRSKYSQKLNNYAKQSAMNGLYTALKKEIQKTAEATGHLVGM